MNGAEQLIAELISTCDRHLTPTEALFVRTCLCAHPEKVLLRITASMHGYYTDEAMAKLALRCAEQIMGGGQAN